MVLFLIVDNIDNEVLSRKNSFGYVRGSVGLVKEICFDYYCFRVVGLIFLGIILREVDKEFVIYIGNNGYRVKRNFVFVLYGYFCLGRFDNSSFLIVFVIGVRFEG